MFGFLEFFFFHKKPPTAFWGNFRLLPLTRPTACWRHKTTCRPVLGPGRQVQGGQRGAPAGVPAEGPCGFRGPHTTPATAPPSPAAPPASSVSRCPSSQEDASVTSLYPSHLRSEVMGLGPPRVSSGTRFNPRHVLTRKQ